VSDQQAESDEPRFGLAFRIIVASVALVSGAIMLLWASDQGSAWKYLPALFCFCIVGTIVLPRKAAIACGYFIAGSILALCVGALYLGLTGRDPLINAIRVCEFYGVPALAFLLFRRLTWRRRGDA
jgi:hypothetical protein